MFRPGVVHHVPPGPAGERTRRSLALMTATRPVPPGAGGVVLVHGHGLSTAPAAAMDAAALHVPLVLSVSAEDLPDRVPAAAVHAARLVVVTDAATARRLAAGGVPYARIRIVPDTGPSRPLDVPAHELGAVVADLEEHYLFLVRHGEPAPQRRPPDDWFDVSVVLVTHDRREQLSRALDSLAIQTYPADRMQVVVVDNASTDGTASMLERWSGPGRDVLTMAEHSMPVVARNAAVAICRSHVVAFTDDDCYPTPGWLECLVAGFRDGVAIVQGRTVPDPTAELTPLSRTQWTPAEYGAYETANVAYRRDALGDEPFDEAFAAAVAGVLGPRFGRYPFGEDAELAWRVKRSGGVSRFSATAVVHHHVWPPDVRYLMRRAVVAAAFPLLVGEVPELRDTMLWRRWFLSRRRAEFLLAAAGVAVAGRHRFAAAAAAPYLWSTLRPREPGRAARLRALPVLAGRDAVEQAALGYGSWRARRLVL